MILIFIDDKIRLLRAFRLPDEQQETLDRQKSLRTFEIGTRCELHTGDVVRF